MCIRDRYLLDRTYESLLIAHIRRHKSYFSNNNLYAESRNKGFLNLGYFVNKFHLLLKNNRTQKELKKGLENFTQTLNDYPESIIMKPWIVEKINQVLEKKPPYN